MWVYFADIKKTFLMKNADFDLVHTGPGGNYTSLTWTGASSQGSWTLPSLGALYENETVPLTATLSGISTSFTGTITANITVNNSGSPVETLSVTITVEASSSSGDMCTVEFGELDSNVSNPGDLSIKIDDAPSPTTDDNVVIAIDEIANQDSTNLSVTVI